MHTTLAQFWQDALYSFLSIINSLSYCYFSLTSFIAQFVPGQ